MNISSFYKYKILKISLNSNFVYFLPQLFIVRIIDKFYKHYKRNNKDIPLFAFISKNNKLIRFPKPELDISLIKLYIVFILESSLSLIIKIHFQSLIFLFVDVILLVNNILNKKYRKINFHELDKKINTDILVDLDGTITKSNSAFDYIIKSALNYRFKFKFFRLLSFLGLPSESLFILFNYQQNKALINNKKISKLNINEKNIQKILNMIDNNVEIKISTFSLPYCLSKDDIQMIEKKMLRDNIKIYYPLIENLKENILSRISKYNSNNKIIISDSSLDIRLFFPFIFILI